MAAVCCFSLTEYEKQALDYPEQVRVFVCGLGMHADMTATRGCCAGSWQQLQREHSAARAGGAHHEGHAEDF